MTSTSRQPSSIVSARDQGGNQNKLGGVRRQEATKSTPTDNETRPIFVCSVCNRLYDPKRLLKDGCTCQHDQWQCEPASTIPSRVAHRNTTSYSPVFPPRTSQRTTYTIYNPPYSYGVRATPVVAGISTPYQPHSVHSSYTEHRSIRPSTKSPHDSSRSLGVEYVITAGKYSYGRTSATHHDDTNQNQRNSYTAIREGPKHLADGRGLQTK